jgi:hypothetical protein
MTRRAWSATPFVIGAVVIGMVGVGAWIISALGPNTERNAELALLDEYCVVCHNGSDMAGALRLDSKDVDQVEHNAEVWEYVVKKLRTGMMPPSGEPRPERSALDAFAASLETKLDRAAAANPTTAPTNLHRMNRTEYANAIRDLLHLDINAATLLPIDNSSEGFDNIAAALSVSPSLVQAYVSSAMKISRAAIGDRSTTRTQVSFRSAAQLRQDRHIDGLPLGTRGGMRIDHNFPLDAEYDVSIRGGFRFPSNSRVDITLDGESITVDNPRRFRLQVGAGPHTLTAAIVDVRRPAGVDDIYAEYNINGAIDSIEIDGPLEPSGIGSTPSRRRLLICQPENAEVEEACARQILTTVASRAFRRPVSREDLIPAMQFFQQGRMEGDFEVGLQHGLSRVLTDPRFLYRLESEPPGIEAGDVYTVDDFDLASRLSFFIWSSIPDDQLLETASTGTLRQPAVIEAELRRMLADPKSSALVDNFASQWLFLRELESIAPDAAEFDDNLRHSMLQETKLLVDAIIREDLGIVRLLDADFTFADARLAEHYGIPGVRGSHFRKIGIPVDNPRRGLLGHGSILTVTSVTNRTSPVIRGSWILENLLGAAPPTPPPNVETTLEGDDGGTAATSVRERLEAHRSNPVCSACHSIMDPLGFSLENYDLIGSWRETDGGRSIDASAMLVDGTRIDGPTDLRNALLDRSDAFVTNATEKLVTYALGRRLEYYDMPAVRAIVRDASDDDYRFSAIVLGIVQSRTFQSRLKEG